MVGAVVAAMVAAVGRVTERAMGRVVGVSVQIASTLKVWPTFICLPPSCTTMFSATKVQGQEEHREGFPEVLMAPTNMILNF